MPSLRKWRTKSILWAGSATELNIGRIDRIPNATVYSLTETVPFIERVRLQQSSLLGHVLC